MSTPKETGQYRVQHNVGKLPATLIEGEEVDGKPVFLVKSDGVDGEVAIDATGLVMNYEPLDVDTANFLEVLVNTYLIAESAAQLVAEWPVQPAREEDPDDETVSEDVEASTATTGYVGYGEGVKTNPGNFHLKKEEPELLTKDQVKQLLIIRLAELADENEDRLAPKTLRLALEEIVREWPTAWKRIFKE